MSCICIAFTGETLSPDSYLDVVWVYVVTCTTNLNIAANHTSPAGNNPIAGGECISQEEFKTLTGGSTS